LASGPLARLPSPSRRRLRRSVATLDRVCAEVVRRRRTAGVRPEDDDLLAVLLRASSELSDQEIRDELVTLVIAGHETVASALTWTLHLLAGDPIVQKELHAELDDVLSSASAGGPVRAPRWSDLPALPYTRAVVDESLRLYPPAWVITRRSVDADVIDGITVPPGTLILISPWLLHRREQTWSEPSRFDPARFLGADQRRREGYLPFGDGPGVCIGKSFALIEAKVCLAAMVKRLRLELEPGARIEPEPSITLRPRQGMPMRLWRR
jgi:cytochrome P450